MDLGGTDASRHLDLYYLRDERSESLYAFQDAPVDETRHTIGARWRTGPSADAGARSDLEVAFQLGRARGVVTDGTPSDIDVRAFLFAGTTHRPLSGLPGAPELGLLFGFASGDDDVDDDRLGTFRPPYPPGRPFGESNPLGAGNIAQVAPSIGFEPLPNPTLTVGAQGY